MMTIIKRTTAIALMLVMILLPSGMVRTAYAAGSSSLTDQQKKSSYGFFVWLSENARTAEEREDAKVAVQILTNTVSSAYRSRVFNDGSIHGGSGTVTYQDLLNATHIGAEFDATSLDNLKDAIDYIDSGNECRAKEGLAPLRVSSGLMAIAEINANYQHGRKNDHSSVFMSLENLALFATGGSADNSKREKMTIDPYFMWYDQEKVNYETGNGKVIGHYLTLTDRQGKMVTTGFGTQDTFVVEGDTLWHEKYYSQHFSNNAWMYNISSGVSTDQYRKYLKDYSCNTIGHSWSEWMVTVEATESVTGKEERKCTICGETQTRDIARLGHSLVRTWAVPATCTSDGYIDYWTCEGCGKIFKDANGSQEIKMTDTVVKAKGHSPVAMQDVAPTCTQDGHKGGKECSVCGAVLEAPEYIAATGHEWSAWIPVAVDEETNQLLIGRYCEHENCEEIQTSVISEQEEDTSGSTDSQNNSQPQNGEENDTTQSAPVQSDQSETTALRVKSLWASQHTVGRVLFKWTQKEGTNMDEDDMWVLKYRMRKIGGNNQWSDWFYDVCPADVMSAWIDIDSDYVIEIHAQADGDTTWSTGIITTPAGGRYHAMKTAHVINTANGKKLAERKVAGSAIARTQITLKVGQTLRVKPSYDYDPGIKDFRKRPRLYPSHMLYDIGDKSMITITKPDGSKYTGGIIDGTAAIKATKAGKTTITFRSPNGRTMIADVTITD